MGFEPRLPGRGQVDQPVRALFEGPQQALALQLGDELANAFLSPWSQSAEQGKASFLNRAGGRPLQGASQARAAKGIRQLRYSLQDDPCCSGRQLACRLRMQQFLYFLPLPQGHGSLRPTR